MQEIKKDKKIFLIVLISGIIILLGLVGGNWQKGYAQTNPTLPTIPIVIDVDPSVIPVNSAIGIFTFFGDPSLDPAPFLPAQWGMEFIEITWYGPAPDSLSCTVNPISVSGDSSQITVDFLGEDPPGVPVCADYLFSDAGDATIYIVNHPGSGDLREQYGPITVHIVNPPTYIYLPIIMK
ncbi:MAG: hypothetical protein CVU46_16460 [Chloroflexi bacterium HGW-Chloroflexi-8]|nr:MAG: hypothetical protein CVU46_16460 [Chloroflexi bacterium HGW-Chloroflexi-8]